MTFSSDQLRVAMRALGPSSASGLGRHLGVSTPTVTAALARLGDEVLATGRGRASRYALRRDVGRSGSHWPLFRITSDGRPERLGELHALQGERQCWFLHADRPLPLYMHGDFAHGFYDDLPWFLMTLRPQGYLGREFIRLFAEDLNAPDDLKRWQADDIVLSLLRFGMSTSGDLVLGESALESALLFAKAPGFAWAERNSSFPMRAEHADRNGPAGSSA